MKCDKCNKTYQHDDIAITVGEIKICTQCVDNAASSKNNVVLNEVLSYVSTYWHSCNKRAMREACVGFYTSDEILNAKILLHSKEPGLFGELIKRQDSRSGERTKDEANIDDLYDWFRKLDDAEVSLKFAALNVKRIPRFNPEEAERTSMLERIIELEEARKAEKNAYMSLITTTCKLEEKVLMDQNH